MKKKENGLICILKGFHGGQMTEKELYEEFVNLARQLFFDGHFEVAVEGKCNRKIYLQAIEFYYHEEDENGIKDPVMYHSNDHEKRELPYFEIGRFNMHQSGVDVTFENPQKHYRASFLIRAYSFEPNPTEKKKCEVRSTHIYDDMFFMGVPMDKSIEITWANDNEDSSNWKSNGMWRLNVADYEKDEKGKYIKKSLFSLIVKELFRRRYHYSC